MIIAVTVSGACALWTLVSICILPCALYYAIYVNRRRVARLDNARAALEAAAALETATAAAASAAPSAGTTDADDARGARARRSGGIELTVNPMGNILDKRFARNEARQVAADARIERELREEADAARAAKARAAREAAARAAAGGEGVEMTQNPLARRASRTRRARARRTPRAATARAHRMGACVCVFYRYIFCESCIGILLT